jgi:hypothetical protein
LKRRRNADDPEITGVPSMRVIRYILDGHHKDLEQFHAERVARMVEESERAWKQKQRQSRSEHPELYARKRDGSKAAKTD